MRIAATLAFAGLVAAAGAVCFAGPAAAQGMVVNGGRQATPGATSTDMQQTQLHALTDVQRQPGVKIDPREEAAYDAFYRLGPELADKKIQLGNAFLEKYPKSVFDEAVDAGLVDAYYQKQDWKSFYSAADKALALNPGNVDVLTTVGWVIPHFFDSRDDNADELLTKAESYERRALQALAALPKPAHLTDAQFASSKAQKSVQAHSALGLVYFRRENYADSAAELQQSLLGNPSPDPTDLYVLGIDLQNLTKFNDAADAFSRCAQLPGNLQQRCAQSAAEARKQIAPPK